MTTETKILGVVLILTIALLGGGVFFLSKGSSKTVEGTAISQIDYNKGEKLGSDSAKVKVVEFSDFQCPACQAVAPYVTKLKIDYPDQVQLIYRHFPLPQHPNGKEAAFFAEAAAEQGKFWEMHDKIFETQSEWSGLSNAKAFFIELSKQLELDEVKLKQALEEDAIKSGINSDIAEGQSLGVNSTPTFYVNGRKLTLKSFDDLNAAVSEELNK